MVSRKAFVRLFPTRKSGISAYDATSEHCKRWSIIIVYPHKVDLQVCYAVDPMLATGGSAIDAINILKQRNIPRISYIGILAAPYGVQKLVQEHPDIEIYIAALDERLNDVGYIVPGLGDAGDRQFGTF